MHGNWRHVFLAWMQASDFQGTQAQGTRAQTYTLGVSYYFNPKIKVMANYIHSSVDGAGHDCLSRQ